MDHQTSPGSPWKNWAVNAVNTSLPPFPPASTVSAPSCPSLAFKPTENGDVPPGPSTPSSFLPEGHSSKDSTSPEQYLLHHPPISTPVDRPTMSDVAEHNYTTSTQMHGQVVQAPQHSQTLEGNTGVDSKGEAVAPPATSEVDQQSDRSASRTSSQASTSAQSTASKSPEEQLFTTTGRPARRATASKSVTYAPEYDKHGNPINKTKKAKTEKTKGNSRASTDIGEPSISRKSSTSQSTAASASTTRSGRAVTKPRDRHRSSDRDAKASMRERAKQKAQAVHDSDDERDSDGQSQEARPSGEEVKGSVEMGAEAQGREGRRSDDDASTEGKDKSQNTEDDEDEIDFLRKESNEADTIADDHTSARVERRRSRVNVEVFVSPSSDDKRRKNTDSAQQNAAKSPKRPRVQSPPEEDTKEAEHIQARDNDDEDKVSLSRTNQLRVCRSPNLLHDPYSGESDEHGQFSLGVKEGDCSAPDAVE